MHLKKLCITAGDAKEPRIIPMDLSDRNAPDDISLGRVTVTEIKKAGGSRTPAGSEVSAQGGGRMLRVVAKKHSAQGF